MQNSVVVVADRRVEVLVEQIVVNELVDSFLCHVGIDGGYAVAEKRRKVVNLTGFAALEYE